MPRSINTVTFVASATASSSRARRRRDVPVHRGGGATKVSAPSPQTHQKIPKTPVITQTDGAGSQLLLTTLGRCIVDTQHVPSASVDHRQAFQNVVHGFHREGKFHFFAGHLDSALEKTDAVLIKGHACDR
ncbi:MAG: hypothetical protein IIB03_03305 [Acidobacteria bacterium]|nr:hypothetical protein [Acidobacteriota bacterium]